MTAERANALLRGSIPTLATLVLLLLLSLPFAIPSLGRLYPLVGFVGVYYWSLSKPEWMPAAAAFVIGLFTDILSGAPLGLTALVLVALQWGTVSQRRALIVRPFVVTWLVFAVMAAGCTLLLWLLACIYFLTLFDPREASVQWLTTALLYPLISGLFSRLRVWLMQQEPH